jgi:Phage integrase, N-terminal SAM-like domain
MEHRPKRLLDQVRDAIRLKHYSIRTEESYVTWIKRYILFHNKRHPKEMTTAAIEAFLTHLAVQQNAQRRPKIKRSAPCCFCIEMRLRRHSTSPSMPFMPKSPGACPRS